MDGGNFEMDDLLAAARRLATMVRETRDYGEQHRHLEPGVLAAMHDAKLFRTLIPRQFGGLQTDPMTAMEVVETISTADGAAGWNLMIGSAYGVWAARLPTDVARTIYSAPDAVAAGALRPSGKARAADGGLICNGRWSFASGIGHSAWWAGGCTLEDGKVRLVFFPASDGELIDTWTTGGMRGTGSHDYAIRELFIPADRIVAMDAPARLDDPLYRFPLMALMDSLMAAVPLGIAPRGDRCLRRHRRRQGLAPFDHPRRPTSRWCRPRSAAPRRSLQAARAWLYDIGGPRPGRTCRPAARCR